MSSSSQVCFNSQCTELKPERPRMGWRLLAGDFAELCDRCASAYEDGRFCDTFHFNATGWRCCESCGKRIHCGCIVSANAFILLDAGGIDCAACARKRFVMGSNYSRAPFFFQSPITEKHKDFSAKNWNQLSGLGSVPSWQSSHLFSPSILQADSYRHFPNEVDLSTSIDGTNVRERTSVTALEKRQFDNFPERLTNGNLKQSAWDMLENGNAGICPEGQPTSCLTASQQQYPLKEESSTPKFAFSMPFAVPNDTNGQIGVSGSQMRQTFQSLPLKQFQCHLGNGADSSSENSIPNGRARVDSRGKSQVLPRYWPRFTDQDLQNLSMDSKSVITPLFEKMLSASDAGRIGRLVLPKKCAEAYLPPISQPEGLPLKVQDSTGKEWMFQFRFWPNNNSRMYVLEGVTTCIQHMQLQAGDTVTFSRLDPEGKLVMGFRKASAAPSSDQDNDMAKNGNGIPANGDAEITDPNSWSKPAKSAFIAREAMGTKTSSRKRRSSTLGSKSKRLRCENDDVLELKITLEEAQELLLPPPNNSPTIVVIEGFEFEEYEDAPILGKPAAFATDDMGPRSCCLAAQKPTLEELNYPTPHFNNPAAPKRSKAIKQETENIDSLEGLDTLANLAILGEGEGLSTSQATTKHPRHRAGCSCIVCIQPPSGKGPKHNQNCECNVCQTVRRRFRTLMMRREKKQTEKEEAPRKKQQQSDEDPCQSNNPGTSCSSQKRIVSDGSDDDHNRVKSSSSPFKGQIDLNIQPERDEELSPGRDLSNLVKDVRDAMGRGLEQGIKTSSICDGDAAVDMTEPELGVSIEIVGNGSILEETEKPMALVEESSAPESAVEQIS